MKTKTFHQAPKKQDMSRTETAVVKVAAPTFLTEYAEAADSGMDLMREYRILPRIKIVQGLSATELKTQYGEGAVVVMPGPMGLAKPGEPFRFIPLFFFPEFIQWRDRRDKAGSPIVTRSFDRNSELAGICRNADQREQQYDGGPSNKPWTYRFVEHLVFAGLIQGDNTPVALSYQRGDYGVGRTLINMIMMRKVEGRQAPMWAQVYEFKTTLRDRNGNKWWGLDPSIPEDPWIAEEDAPMMKELHDGLMSDYRAQAVGVDRADEEEIVEEATTDDGTM